MPKVRRTPPPQHIVVVDTNILWEKDKKLSVSPAFDAFWKQNSQLIPMTLNVPEVVFGELHFQQTTSALKALSNITENYTELAGITNTSYSHKCNESTIRTQVKAKLDRWLKSHNGQLLPVPMASINWLSIIDSAIWRKPPFSFDPKDQKNEKGFRDAVILETLAHTCAIANKDETVIFVCNDYLLRTTAELKLKTPKKLLAFDSLADFEAYINLTQQQFNNKFIQSIQNHARSKFYSKSDQNCIYLKHELRTKINNDYSTDLLLKNPSTNALSLLTMGSKPDNTFAKMIRQLNLIQSTQFSKLEGNREFHWISHIDVVRIYEIETQFGLIDTGTPSVKRLQIVGFDVKWKTNVKADGRFHDIELLGIEKKEKQILEATDENLKQWRVT